MTDTVPTSAWEREIVEAIRAGLTFLELLTGPWTRAEVDATMRRHHLTEDELSGRIVHTTPASEGGA